MPIPGDVETTLTYTTRTIAVVVQHPPIPVAIIQKPLMPAAIVTLIFPLGAVMTAEMTEGGLETEGAIIVTVKVVRDEKVMVLKRQPVCGTRHPPLKAWSPLLL